MLQESGELFLRLERASVDREEQPELGATTRIRSQRPGRACCRRQVGLRAERLARGREHALAQPFEDGLEHLLLGTEAMNE